MVTVELLAFLQSLPNSPFLSAPGEATASFTGVPWYFYECQRAAIVVCALPLRYAGR